MYIINLRYFTFYFSNLLFLIIISHTESRVPVFVINETMIQYQVNIFEYGSYIEPIHKSVMRYTYLKRNMFIAENLFDPLSPTMKKLLSIQIVENGIYRYATFCI